MEKNLEEAVANIPVKEGVVIVLLSALAGFAAAEATKRGVKLAFEKFRNR